VPSPSGTFSSTIRGGSLARRAAQESPDRPARRDALLGTLRLLPLLVIVALCLAVVAFAAHGASLVSPTVGSGDYPSWLAGPLHSLWPGAVPDKRLVGRVLTGALVLMFLAYLLVVHQAEKIDARWIIAGVLVLQAIIFLSPPLEYTDIFNYMDYARMGVVHHLDPYQVLPVNGPHSDQAYVLSNWHYLRSPYGPLFTLITYALVPFGVAGSFWAFKVIVALCSLALLSLVWRAARLVGRSPARAVAFVGLNPIVLIWGLGGEHNDCLMVLLVFASLYLLLAPRLRGEAPAPPSPILSRAGLLVPELAAGVMLVAAVGIKIPAVIFLPLALAIAPRRRALLAGIAGAGVVLLAASLAAFGPHLGGVHAQSTLVAPEGLPNLLGILLGLGGATSGLRAALTLLAGLVILAAAVRAWRHPGDAIACACASVVALIFTLGWSAPWYVLWALPFVALVHSRRWRPLLLSYTLYALIASSPAIGGIENALHFHPRGDRLGREEVARFEYLGAR
jgi:hypothetical protein